MAKRGASSDLNHTNWDRDEEPEDAGMFSKAPEDVIKRRVIKVAKRRNPLAHLSEEDEKPKAFGGFTAFTKTPSSNFNFLSNLNSKTASNNDDAKKTNGKAAESPVKAAESPVKAAESPVKDPKQDEYYAKVKGLNESVLDWIKTHVSKNPFVNLQPIFKDYDKYFEELEKGKLSEKADVPKADFKFSSTNQPFGIASKNTTSPISNSTSISTVPTTTAPTFQFSSGSAPKFSFISSTNTNTTKPSGFQFGISSADTSTATTVTLSSNASIESTKPLFSFGNTANLGSSSQSIFPTKPSSEDKGTTEEHDNEDEPPKVEFTPVVEEGHVYTIRCKVFVKKDGGFGDRGVGNLYLKSVPDSEKYQLIVRADTNLGNLLCNFILSEGIPTQRMGKKDVMLVCIPTPDTAPPPVPILLRVKTTEDADELLKTLEKYKK